MTKGHHRFEDKSNEVIEQIAIILGKVCHHVHPKIVQRVVEDNLQFKDKFKKFCDDSDLVNTYFYDGSDCIFPGVRRPVNTEKVGVWKNNICDTDKTILNDNTYPRHLWAYLCAGRGYAGGKNGFYSTSGLNLFELAHIFSHKTDERILEPKVYKKYNPTVKPYALFTSASNVVLIPNWLPKPTDKSDSLKLLFYKRHKELYGNIVKLPGLNDFDETKVPTCYSTIKWAEPELPIEWEQNVDKVLNFRASHLSSKYSKQ